jgi:fermentation-respiration switch protein FrsA (DUF1100 family)
MGTLFVDKLDPQSGTSIELGSSGDTVSVNTGATTNLLGNVTLGASGKTITVPSGCTITNGGTASGFGNAGTEIAVAKRSGNQVSIADNSWTKINYNVDVYDADSNFDTSNYRYVAPSAGRYYFTATAYLWGQIGNVSSRFYKNGSAQNNSYFIDNAGYSGNTYEFTVRSNAIFDLAQNDYIEFYVKSNTNSGTTVADEVGTQFLAFRLD